MSSLRQVGLGILTALFSIALVFGSVLLALTEGGVHLAMLPLPSPTSAPPIDTPRPGEATYTPTMSPAPTEVPTQPSTSCKEAPPDWISKEVFPGETLAGIASAYGISVDLLRQANCLTLDTLPDFSLLSVPPQTQTPTHTATSTLAATEVKQNKTNKAATRAPSRCSGHPASWIAYKVKRGDTIFHIASSYDLRPAELMAANCLASDVIRVGQVIFVPGYPSKTPKLTATPRRTATLAPVATETMPGTTEPAPPPTEPAPGTTDVPVNTQPQPTAGQPPPVTSWPAPVPTEAPTAYP